MHSVEQIPAIPVTARTEYLTARHRVAAVASATALVTAIIAMVVLNHAEVPGALTAAVVAALVMLGLGTITYGRLGRHGAVLITVDTDTVYLGHETHGIVSYPLSALTAVRRCGPADRTSATVNGPRLTVRGQGYLELTFSTDTGTDVWQVAVAPSDPAAAEVFSRLAATLPGAESAAAESPLASRITDAGTDEAAKRLWEEAFRRHDDILGAYGAYELDPAMLLRYPAITDVTVEQTQTFHVALDEASALRTESYPGNRGVADAYQQAVVALRRAWIGCEAHGKKVGTSYLDPADQAELDTALKLYHHAMSSTSTAEQASYYGRARDIVTKLTDRGVLHPPKAQLAQREGVTRRAIEAAR